MSMIKTQIENLRYAAGTFENVPMRKLLNQAADTIEALSAKLKSENTYIHIPSIRYTERNFYPQMTIDFTDKVKVHFDSVDLDTTAILKLVQVNGFDMLVAKLYDIPKEILDSLPLRPKAIILERELEFYHGNDNILIQVDQQPVSYWFNDN